MLGLKIKKETDNQSDSKPDPRFDTPRKLSAVRFNYAVSHLLFHFNPLFVAQSFLQMAGIMSEKAFGHPVLDAELYNQKAKYILPVTGEWRVINGGITKETSHSWSIPSQRFACDLVRQGQMGVHFKAAAASSKIILF